jgi:hypothetical protein
MSDWYEVISASIFTSRKLGVSQIMGSHLLSGAAARRLAALAPAS